ncbi:MAG TPA: hydroxyacid dehydrogenase [Candidatus Binataceae bacterium]|nr:hydroxyacid dehydrogenase [Candidatus Binataceae bacterium]
MHRAEYLKTTMAENFRVLLSDSLADQGIDALKRNPRIAVEVKTGLRPEQLAAIIAPYHALVIRSATKVTHEVIEAATSLKVIGRAGVGVDNVDLDSATRRGIVVMNSPLGNSVTTAEHTISMMMAMARHIPEANAALRAGKWERGRFTGVELCNKTLGVIGLGNIGRIVADRATGLKMKVVGFDPILTAEAAARAGIELVSLDDLFRRSDFITVHAPLTDETRGIVGAAAFKVMHKGVRIINCARGGIVDESALLDALKTGRIAGAGLDCTVEEPLPAASPLWDIPNVLITPHTAGETRRYEDNVIDLLLENLDRLWRGEQELKNGVV